MCHRVSCVGTRLGFLPTKEGHQAAEHRVQAAVHLDSTQDQDQNGRAVEQSQNDVLQSCTGFGRLATLRPVQVCGPAFCVLLVFEWHPAMCAIPISGIKAIASNCWRYNIETLQEFSLMFMDVSFHDFFMDVSWDFADVSLVFSLTTGRLFPLFRRCGPKQGCFVQLRGHG